MIKRTGRKRTKSERAKLREKIVSFVVLFIVSFFWIVPLLYMVGTSFKSDLDLQLHPETLFPSSWSEWTLGHYSGFIIREGKIDNMPLWMLNSLWSTLATVGLTVLLDLLTAYAVVFMRFKGKHVLMKFLLLWMAVPGVIGTAPSFAIYSSIRHALEIDGAMGIVYLHLFLDDCPRRHGYFQYAAHAQLFRFDPQGHRGERPKRRRKQCEDFLPRRLPFGKIHNHDHCPLYIHG